MDKFLYCDGTGAVIEAGSAEELASLVKNAPEPAKLRVWIFGSPEWIGYPAFLEQIPALNRRETAKESVPASIPVLKPQSGRRLLKKFLFATAIITGALLVFNFTYVKWEKAAPLQTTAARPGNVPVMDIDSLISDIEWMRNRTLDRNTRLNLRLRNTWPDRILLQLEAAHETGSAGSRFSGLKISIDNTTGFNLDNAVVNLWLWNDGKPGKADTLQFSGIRFDKLSIRELKERFRCDSISVSFQSISAKAFNFCYSADIKNNSGNANDRWFCSGGLMSR